MTGEGSTRQYLSDQDNICDIWDDSISTEEAADASL